jgi:uncharacterized protein DUF3761
MFRGSLLRGGIAVGIAAALGVAPAFVESGPMTVVASCGPGYYENSDGQCIHDPSSGPPLGGAPGLLGGVPPSGATAICRDGTYSFSTHHSGTCSGHRGVRQWLLSTVNRNSGLTVMSSPGVRTRPVRMDGRGSGSSAPVRRRADVHAGRLRGLAR